MKLEEPKVQRKGAVLVEYFCTDDVTLIFGVRADWKEPRVAEVRVPLAEIRRETMRYFGDELDESGNITRSATDKIFDLDEAAWQGAFGPFVEPIRDWVSEGEILWLVPHDMLHYLPLHALKLDGRYLIERNPIVYSPSASVMKYCRLKRKGRPKHALVIGDPTGDRKEARDEAHAIASMFHTTPLLQNGATKRMVKEKLASVREEIDVLHFACHGYFDHLQPLKSGIILAKHGDEDPTLTAEEIFTLQMHAELVVLSACVTGVNERKPGDELIGLTRSLIYAGTPSVVVSLWNVEDVSTRLLMQIFYEEWLAPRDPPITKAEALQRAQIAVMQMTAEEALARLERIEAANGEGADLSDVGITDDLGIPAGEKRKEMNPKTRQLEREKRLGLEASIVPTGMLDAQGLYAKLFYWAPFILVGDWL